MADLARKTFMVYQGDGSKNEDNLACLMLSAADIVLVEDSQILILNDVGGKPVCEFSYRDGLKIREIKPQ